MNISFRKLSVLLGLMTGLLLATQSSHAAIVGGEVLGGQAFVRGGIFQELTPPIGNVGNNNHQSYNLFAFNEDQNITLGADLAVDLGPSGFIAAGTQVASHYVFYDPRPLRQLIGYVEFDTEILGVLTQTGSLIATDFLANTTANYLSPSLRGLEPDDFASINAGNPNRLDVDFIAGSPGDYVRVITRAASTNNIPSTPEPATMALMSLGLAGYGLRRRFKKN